MENPLALTILFVLNPKSGSKKKFDLESVIKDYFKDLPHSIHFYILSGKDDTDSVKYWIDSLKVTRVVAAGGDGTVNFVAKHLLGSDLLFGIVPAGSANGMAKELSIPSTPSEALNIITGNTSKACDVIQINEKNISIHLSDLGLNARLVKYFEKSKLRGMYSYALMLIKILWQKTPLHAHIITHEKEFDTKAYMIVIANASKYGTGAIINPEGKTDDGFFEIVVVKKVSISRMVRMFFGATNFDTDRVEIFKTTQATITTKKGTHFQVDGEYQGKVNKVVAEILPAKLKVLVSGENEL